MRLQMLLVSRGGSLHEGRRHAAIPAPDGIGVGSVF